LALDGTLIRTWPSITDAARELNMFHETIRRYLRGKTRGIPNTGFRWRFHEDDDLPDETWRTVTLKGVDYTVSDLGRINVYGTKKYGSPLHRYLMFRHQLAHRVVAAAFVDNPEGKPQVNHINGDRYDNRAANLEWVTASENNLHAVASGLTSNLRRVDQFDPTTHVRLNTYASLSDAGRAVNRSPTNIGAVCQGIKKSCAGYEWAYAN
jgi:HNH endonuclease/NUMOD1 domain